MALHAKRPSLPFPPDPRHVRFEDILATTASSHKVSRLVDVKLPAHLDHSSQNQIIATRLTSDDDCVSDALCMLLRWQWKRNTDKTLHLNPRFLYKLRKNVADSGMSVPDALDIAYKYGIVTQKECNWDDVTHVNLRSRPHASVHKIRFLPDAVWQSAAARKIRGYAMINTEDGVKRALYALGPVLVTLPCYNNTTRFWVPRKASEVDHVEDHTLLIVGYNDKGFILRSSWGGNKSITWTFSDFGKHKSIWCILDKQMSRHPIVQHLKTEDPSPVQSRSASPVLSYATEERPPCVPLQILTALLSEFCGYETKLDRTDRTESSSRAHREIADNSFSPPPIPPRTIQRPACREVWWNQTPPPELVQVDAHAQASAVKTVNHEEESVEKKNTDDLHHQGAMFLAQNEPSWD